MKGTLTAVLCALLLLAGCGGCGKGEKLRRAEPHFLRGLALEKDSSYSSAVSEYQAAIGFYPDYLEAHLQLGNLDQRLGQAWLARICFEKVIDLNGSLAAAYNNLGNVMGQMGRLDSAIVCYRQAVQRDDHLASAYYNLGNALWLKHDIGAAQQTLERAVALAPGEDRYIKALGLVYAQSQNSAAAVPLLRQVLKKNPSDAEGRFQLAGALEQLKRYDEAIREWETYAALNAGYEEKTIAVHKIRDLRTLQIQEKLAQQRERLKH